MNEIIKNYEQSQIQQILKSSKVSDFAPGDTVKVNVKIKEGNKERVQAFQGVCIGKKNNGLNSSFTVRKISSGEGVERVFPLYSNVIDSIERVKVGDVVHGYSDSDSDAYWKVFTIIFNYLINSIRNFIYIIS